MDDEHKLAYSVAEAAAMVGISRPGIYNELNRGRLVGRKIAGRTVIMAEDLRS